MSNDKSDVVLDGNWTRVVENLAITTEKGKDADVLVEPEWATISLGGGAGSNSDGDLKWQNENGDPLIHFTAASSSTLGPTRIFAEGQEGRLRLGGAGTSGDFEVHDSNGNPQIEIDGDEGSIQFRNGAVGSSGRASPMMYMFRSGWANDDQSIVAHSPKYPDWGLLYKDPTDKMVFESGGDDVMTVDLGSERVGIGTEDPDCALHVEGRAGGTSGWTTLSDARCKQNVEPLSNPVETVQQLRGVNYEWDDELVDERGLDDDQQVGFVAQEVEEVLPEAVTENEDGLRAMSQGDVTPVLVEAIKEQQETIEDQRDTIDAQEDTIEDQQDTIEEQEARLQDLESRLEEIESAVLDGN